MYNYKLLEAHNKKKYITINYFRGILTVIYKKFNLERYTNQQYVTINFLKDTY